MTSRWAVFILRYNFISTAVRPGLYCGVNLVVLRHKKTVPKQGSGTAMKKDRVSDGRYTPSLSEGSSLIPSKSDSVSKSSAG